MSIRELLALLLVCLIWGCHFVVLKLTVGVVAEPLFYAAIRMTIVALLLSPLLRIHSGHMLHILIAGACLGGLNYAFMFYGVRFSNASIAAITLELYVPLAMILSVLIFREKVGVTRIVSMLIAFAGVVLIGRSNDIGFGQNLPLGIALLCCTALVEAIGAIFVKKATGVAPLALMAWFAVVGAGILWPATLLVEQNQFAVFHSDKIWQFILALSYTAILASIVGHTTYYWLLHRMDVSRLAPSLMLTTLIAVVAGIIILKEPVTMRLVIGGGLTLIGAGVILVRNQDKNMPTVAEVAPIEN
ncbi:MAG: DMT family transporter [bacterium]